MDQASQNIAVREDDLTRRLTPRQLGMIALGGAIGTGFFLGSGVTVRLAGPGVIISYVLSGIIALIIAWTLAEMAAAHPVAGSFGVYAEIYLNPWAGFTMRCSYWLGQVIAAGSELVAAAIYCRLWFPNIPGWLWVAAFSLGLFAANAWSVASFGEFEYWFALIKVAIISLFLIVGAGLLFGVGPLQHVGFAHYTHQGGFLPHGWTGVFLAMTIATFSFLGVEEVAVTAGEAREPQRAVPRAMRSVFWRLGLFYIGGIAVLVGLVPWTQVGLDASPFVRALQAISLPAAPGIMNFVVITAALSSANAGLYLTTRMLYSLARGGYVPARFGRVTRRGIPLWALIASSAGLLVAVVVQTFFPRDAYLYLVGICFFGGLFVWTVILLTHLRFRRRHPESSLKMKMPGFPFTTWLGILGLAGVAICCWFVPGMRLTLLAGGPWLGFLSAAYWLHRKARV